LFVSDSGTINEESSILDFPAVNIRETHERLEAMDEAAVVMTGLDPAKVVLGVELARVQKNRSRMFPLPIDYANPVVSKKVARIILSYTDYVRRVVWHA
jgi:UDP-N-acetylglucosamine 2-epimerase (non-hydrolysing)